MAIKVSFDFDSTLDRKEVQDYVRSLIYRGVDVWVVTSRYDELHKQRFRNNPTNEDLYKVTDELNIPRYKIRFTCMRSKHEYLNKSDILWHLDDDWTELKSIKAYTDVIPIDVTKSNWKVVCEATLLNNGCPPTKDK